MFGSFFERYSPAFGAFPLAVYRDLITLTFPPSVVEQRLKRGRWRNPVQFQKGMSLAAFQAGYGSKESCEGRPGRSAGRRVLVVQMPGPQAQLLRQEAAFQCSACRTQTSLKAGTIAHKSKVPRTKWFLAIYLLTQSKNDISALGLSRQLGVAFPTFLTGVTLIPPGRDNAFALMMPYADTGGEASLPRPLFRDAC